MKKPFGRHGLYKKISALQGLNIALSHQTRNEKLFILNRIGGAVKISKCITCSYRKVPYVNYLFHAESARNNLLQKTTAPPPFWRLNSGPLRQLHVGKN